MSEETTPRRIGADEVRLGQQVEIRLGKSSTVTTVFDGNLRITRQAAESKHGQVTLLSDVPTEDPSRTLPGHPGKVGVGYDCNCGGCLALPVRRAEYEVELISRPYLADAPAEDREPTAGYRTRYEDTKARLAEANRGVDQLTVLAFDDEGTPYRDRYDALTARLDRVRKYLTAVLASGAYMADADLLLRIVDSRTADDELLAAVRTEQDA